MLDPALAAFLNTGANIAIIVVLVGLSAFSLTYGLAYHWKKRRAGRAQFFFINAILFVALASFAAVWIGPEYWVRPLWRFVAWWSLAYSVGYLFYALIRNWNSPEQTRIETRTGPGSIITNKEAPNV